MPESRIRRKSAYTAPAAKSSVVKPNHRLFVPVMVALLVGGLAWIVTYYITQTKYPIPGIENWNLVVGFGILLSGFVMTTRWR
jgi:hydrogenase-4 membrane subunit HyfE